MAQQEKIQANKLYIERKTRDGKSLNDRGPAVIGTVTYSKTGRTIYYKGLELRRPLLTCRSASMEIIMMLKVGMNFGSRELKKEEAIGILGARHKG